MDVVLGFFQLFCCRVCVCSNISSRARVYVCVFTYAGGGLLFALVNVCRADFAQILIIDQLLGSVCIFITVQTSFGVEFYTLTCGRRMKRMYAPTNHCVQYLENKTIQL